MSGINPLSNEIIAEKEAKLFEVLNILSCELDEETANDTLNECVLKLIQIYDHNYRQQYSRLYPYLAEVCYGDLYNLEALIFNIELLRIHVRDSLENEIEYPEYLYGALIKLSDHINLEYQRYVDTKELRDQIEESFMESENLRDQIEYLETGLKKAKKKASKIQTEMVMILAIFAAIIMAFSGGLTILGGSLTSMFSVDPFKLAFVVLLCGIIVFNTIASLMHAVNKIVTDFNDINGKSSYKYRDRTVVILEKGKKFNHWYILLFNIMLVSMLIIDAYLWHVYG